MKRWLATAGASLVVALALAGTAGAVTITEFPMDPGAPANQHVLSFITTGPGDVLWMTDPGTGKAIHRITPDGVRLPVIPAKFEYPVDLVAAPGGTVYWTERDLVSYQDDLIRRNPDGSTDAKPAVPKYDDGDIYATELDATGAAVWTTTRKTGSSSDPMYSTMLCRVGSGSFLGFPALSDCTSLTTPPGSRFTDVTLGPGGYLWVTSYEQSKILRWSGGSFTGFDLPAGARPYRIARGPDGNMWATGYGDNAIYRIAQNGAFKRFPLPAGRGPNDIVAGPDGALWFTEYDGNGIGRMTTDGKFTNDFPVPTAASHPWGITVGPDGALWFTESTTVGAKVARLLLDKPGNGGGGGDGGAVADRFPPRFDRPLAMARKRFRASGSPTPVSARRRATPAGSSFTFTLSEPATVTIVIAKAKTGRRVRGACRAVTRANRGRPHCTRYVTAGTLRRSGKTAANQIAFSGRIGRRKLSAGSYRATAAAKDPAGNASAPSRTGFTIVTR